MLSRRRVTRALSATRRQPSSCFTGIAASEWEASLSAASFRRAAFSIERTGLIVRTLLAGLIAAAICVASALPSGAAPTPPQTVAGGILPVGQNLHYYCHWTQRFGGGIAWTGDLKFSVNADGIVNGTYRSNSVRPDPFYGKIVTGTNIRLSFGIVPNISVRGTVANNAITGATQYNGGTLEFVADPSH